MAQPTPAASAAIPLPDDLPVSVPDGGVVNGIFPPVAGSMQEFWVVRVLYPPGSRDAIVNHFDTWFAASDIDVDVTPGASSHRWRNVGDGPLQWVTLNVADRFYGDWDRVEVWYSDDDS